MSEFNPGDIVTPVNVRDSYARPMRKLLDKSMIVISITKDRRGNEIVYAGVIGETNCWYWYAQDLMLVSKAHSETVDTCLTQQSQAWSSVVKTLDEVMPSWTLHHETGEAAAVAAIKKLARKAKKPKATPETKPLQVGDLVAYDDGIGVIFDKPPHEDSEYQVTRITGRWVPYDYVKAHELKKIGSIRKKIEHLMAQLPEPKDE